MPFSTSESSTVITTLPAITIDIVFMIALLIFWTIVLFTSVDVSDILKERKAVPGTITSLAPTFDFDLLSMDCV